MNTGRKCSEKISLHNGNIVQIQGFHEMIFCWVTIYTQLGVLDATQTVNGNLNDAAAHFSLLLNLPLSGANLSVSISNILPKMVL